MPQSPKNKPLPVEHLATLFLQLAQMEEAGLPASQAFSLLEKNNADLNRRLGKMQRAIASGTSIADAGFNAGIFLQNHKALIKAAEESGRLAAVYRQLASHYGTRLSHAKKIKSRLYLPAVVLFLALCIEPAPLLVSGKITPLHYLGLSFGRFLLVISGLYVLSRLPAWFGSAVHGLQMQLPKVSGWIKKRQINDFLLMLAIMLEAGMAFAEALPLAVGTIGNTSLRKHFDGALRICHSGDSVTQILSKVDEIESVALQIINSGESSGKLAESILHYANREAESIRLQDEMFAEWLPRLFYLGVAGWMAASILGTA